MVGWRGRWGYKKKRRGNICCSWGRMNQRLKRGIIKRVKEQQIGWCMK